MAATTTSACCSNQCTTTAASTWRPWPPPLKSDEAAAAKATNTSDGLTGRDCDQFASIARLRAAVELAIVSYLVFLGSVERGLVPPAVGRAWQTLTSWDVAVVCVAACSGA